MFQSETKQRKTSRSEQPMSMLPLSTVVDVQSPSKTSGVSDQPRSDERTTSVGDKTPSRSVIGPRGGVYSASDTHAVMQVDSCGLEPERKENCRRRRGKKNKNRKTSSLTTWAAPAKPTKPPRRFQKQKQALCGIISINNALGRKVLDREEVDAMVKKLKRGGDEAGNYSAEPLHLALQQKGHGLISVKGKGHMWLASQKTGRYLVLGWHLSFNKPMHFIAVDAAANLVIDGSKKTMMKLDVGGILGCLSYGVHSIWKIV